MIKLFYKVRDYLWSYPDMIMKLVKHTRPFIYVLFASILSFALFNVITADRIFSAFKFSDIDGNEPRVIQEGSVGNIVSLNPIFVNHNGVDRDLHEMLYDKFLYVEDDGSYAPAIAKNWEMSNEGKTYSFTISDSYSWHDGEKLDVDDVLFTIRRAVEVSEDGRYDTFGNIFKDIEIEKTGKYSLKVDLENASANFLESMSFYVIPLHIYEDIDVKNLYTYSLQQGPVGSGILKVDSIYPSEVTLIPNANHPALKENELEFDKYIYKVFPTEEDLYVALKNNRVDIANNSYSLDSEMLEDYGFVEKEMKLLTNKKLLYFNLRNDLLKDDILRQAVSYSIDKEKIVKLDTVYGDPVYSVLPSNSWALNTENVYYKHNKEKVSERLNRINYTQEGKYFRDKDGELLELSLTYLDNQNNRELAKEIKNQLDSVGIAVRLKGVDYVSLVNEVLATRNFELLLLQAETNYDPDQYNLWHGTKKEYPDLNIAGYDNNKVNLLLERARTTTNKKDRKADYILVQKYLRFDSPVIPLFEPEYALSYRKAKVTEVTFGSSLESHNRYRYLTDWKFNFE